LWKHVHMQNKIKHNYIEYTKQVERYWETPKKKTKREKKKKYINFQRETKKYHFENKTNKENETNKKGRRTKSGYSEEVIISHGYG